MKCPRCGAMVEDGKTVCFMCGASVDSGIHEDYGSSQSFSTGFGNDNGMDSGMPPRGGGIDDYNPSLNNDYYRRKDQLIKEKYREKKEAVSNINYKKDIFDIISENKLLIRIVLFLLLALLIGFLVVRWYKKKTAIAPKIPLVGELYYEVDGAFKEVSGSSNGTLMYILSGDRGNSCSITVAANASTSENFIADYYKGIRAKSVADLYDNDYIIKDYLKVPLFQENQLAVNGNAWYYLYEYYRLEYPGEYSLLKYRYLNTVKNGYVYTVILGNIEDDGRCNLYLDNFVRSLEFVEVKETKTKAKA